MSTFVRYDNEIVVTLPATLNSWETVDLSTYLVDTSAVGAIVRVIQPEGSSPNSANHGLREMLSTNSLLGILHNEIYGFAPIGFGGSGNSFKFNRSATTVGLRLSGEIHGTHAKLHDVAIDVSALSDGAWVNVNPTLIGGDSLGDIAAVIHRVRINTDTTFGLREKGSAELSHSLTNNNGGWDFFVTGVSSDGFYQIFNTTKFGVFLNTFMEVGYVLKTGNIVTIPTPSAESLVQQTPGFGVLDLSATVSANAIMAGGKWIEPVGLIRQDGFIRNTGSTDDGGARSLSSTFAKGSVKTNFFALDSTLQAEYTMEDSGSDFWVRWYETSVVGEGNQFVLDTGYGVGDSANIILG